MTTQQEYNGWTNYETWLFNLWHDDHYSDDAKTFYEEAEACDTFSKAENAAFALGDYIKDNAYELYKQEGPRFVTDIVNASISAINFHEIAKHYIEEITE